MVLGAHGVPQANSVTHRETAIKLPLTQPPLALHPIAFQVHTHSLGTTVTGWRVTPDGTWTLIGRRSPQSQETFADSSVVILAARCTLNNTLSRPVLLR